MAQTLPPTYAQLTKVFADEDLAREWLEAKRWPNGPVCPHCESVNQAYKLTPKATSSRPVRKGVWKCRACRMQFTVTIGTVFAETHIPLNKWLYAIHLMCASKKGVSALQLSRTVEVTYKSAWFLAHRIRKAMEKDPMRAKLTGTVEADETYVGGKGTGSQGGPMAGGSKIAVFTLISRDGEARSTVVEDVKAKTLKGIIREEVEGTAHIMTDQMQSYHGLGREFASHGTVDHSAQEYVRGVIHVNFSESYFSLFKRGIIGAFHHISRKHIQRYLEEFDFRWTRRKITDSERMLSAVAGTEGKRLYYRAPNWLKTQSA
ncbi:MAG TPA: IS1595 family transposase [Thermoanaerobaculia bacterium]|nr:IS1595 family transposase [Thermoanaerobaculia bacterium]